jgi:hypothetical protein
MSRATCTSPTRLQNNDPASNVPTLRTRRPPAREQWSGSGATLSFSLGWRAQQPDIPTKPQAIIRRAYSEWRAGSSWRAHRCSQIAALGTKVLVTNYRNGRSVIVRINDRGPFIRNRIIDGLFQRRRDIFLDVLGPTGMVAGRPRGAFYGLVKLPERHASALDFARALLLEQGVAVVPGDTFGPSTSRMVRLAFIIGEEPLTEGLRRIARALGNGQ